MLKASVVGASGYSGGELVRLLVGHPEVDLENLTASSQAGSTMAESFPHLEGFSSHVLREPDWRKLGTDSDVVFLCLPHGLSMDAVPILLDAGCRVVDLGADYRLKDAALYSRWYGLEHRSRELLNKAVYGLPELGDREAIASADLVACPGCYPTAATLALLPLLRSVAKGENSISGTIIVDAKSGVSGAGRAASMGTHFSEITENFKPYKVGSHRHQPEMQQTFSSLGAEGGVFFTPHLVPMIRGIVATCYVQPGSVPTQAQASEMWRDCFSEDLFVRVLEGTLPQSKATSGSNFCDVSVVVDEEQGLVVGLAALDNLVKGAAGQAVQCMNLMFGFSEEEGLWQPAVYP